VRLIQLEIQPQPDDQTCGPTCLHALYGYYGFDFPLEHLIAEIEQLEEGGTVAVSLANHALRNGFSAVIYTYNLQIFDPTWFGGRREETIEKLRQQARLKSGRKLRRVSHEYIEFLEGGGDVDFQDLTPTLLQSLLARGTPILTGLSATYLYNCSREIGSEYDDIRGEPTGHFVVLCSYEPRRRKVWIADPLHPNPLFPSQQYEIDVDRVISSILLGTLTYDANLLIIQPKERKFQS
jgi:hypothetical protein